MSRAAWAGLALGLLSLGARAEDWSLRLPKEEKVVYRGIVNPDEAGYGAGPQMMYGPGLLGFAVTLAGHAAFQDAQTNRQLAKLQEKADQVLVPYRSALADYSYEQLMQRAFEHTTLPADRVLVKGDERVAGRWLMDCLPAFGLTPDSSALVLEHAVAVYPPQASEPLYRNMIRVVSRPRPGNYDADKIKDDSARLLAHSLDLLMTESAGKAVAAGPEKTFRYVQGGARKMERATLVAAYCDRVVIRTLRGWLMSVPTGAEPAQGCTPSPNGL